jgi:hypothetical protein
VERRRLTMPQRYVYLVTALDPATGRTISLSTPNLRAARTKTSFLRESSFTQIEVKRVDAASGAAAAKSRRRRSS